MEGNAVDGNTVDGNASESNAFYGNVVDGNVANVVADDRPAVDKNYVVGLAESVRAALSLLYLQYTRPLTPVQCVSSLVWSVSI